MKKSWNQHQGAEWKTKKIPIFKGRRTTTSEGACLQDEPAEPLWERVLLAVGRLGSSWFETDSQHSGRVGVGCRVKGVRELGKKAVGQAHGICGCMSDPDGTDLAKGLITMRTFSKKKSATSDPSR